VKEKIEKKQKKLKRKENICFKNRTMGLAHNPNVNAKYAVTGYAPRPGSAAEGGI
jgi:hypothetical protein